MKPPERIEDGPLGIQLSTTLKGMNRLDVEAMFLNEDSLAAGARNRLQSRLAERGPDRANQALNDYIPLASRHDLVAMHARGHTVSALMTSAKSAVASVDNLPHHKQLVLHQWMADLTRYTQNSLNQSIEILKMNAHSHTPEVAARFDSALAEEHYWALTALAQGDSEVLRPDRSVFRQTPWRHEAELAADRTNPLKALAQVARDQVQQFLQHWSFGTQEEDTRRALRKFFVEIALGKTSTKETRHYNPKFEQIHCEPVLATLARQNLNPFFVPQLVKLTEIFVVSAPTIDKARSSNYHERFANFASEALSQENSIVVLLAPGLQPQMRRAVVQEIRKRGLAAAVIDDIDLSRLIANDGAAPTDARKFLELVLEQVPLNHPHISPFTSEDGQTLRRELFVGRVKEAQQLAFDPQFSRVFSGRRLGKSALLKYIANKYDKHADSNTNLRVVFTSIAGNDSEQSFVEHVIREMERALDFTEPFQDASLQPEQRLKQYVQRYLDTHKKTSLLLLLDEADSFVEGQLDQYIKVSEKCISFVMHKGSIGVDPIRGRRFRVVLCGYRVTNTLDGPWANAGGVLLLAPLEDLDAERLIAEPFARLGIDVGNHAGYIARRCGNQPAVIQKFGATLLSELAKRIPHDLRDYIHVTNEHVAATFNSEAVSADIRQVIFNNFQHHNPVGHIIFVAALQAFSKLSPGLHLSEPEEAILAQIRAIDGNVDWLEKRDPTLVGEIAHQLKDFEERKLISRDSVTRACRLRVVNSLQTLLTGDLIPSAQKYIELVRRAPEKIGRYVYRSVLSDRDLEDAKVAYGDALFRAVFVTGLWKQALEHKYLGVTDRMGILPSSVFTKNDNEARISLQKAAAITSASAEDVDSLLSGTLSARLLVGGVDLARKRLSLVAADNINSIEWVALGRVPEAGIRWWFEQVRGLRFTTQNAIEQISSATARSMFFLNSYNAILEELTANESEVSNYTLEQSLNRLAQQTDVLACQLRDGSSDLKLDKREIEVLVMLCQMAKSMGPILVDTEFTAELWNDCANGHGDISPPQESDRVHIELLLRTGLIDLREGQFAYSAGNPDPIFAIAEKLSV